MQAEYFASGYSTHTYFLTNYVIDNVTDYISLYMMNGTTAVLFTVLDQYESPVKDAYIKVLQYDVGTGAFTTIEILQTNTVGQAVGNVVLDVVWYKLLVEYEGNIVYTDEPVIFTAATKTIRISLGTEFFDRFDNVLGISHDMNFDNNTNIFDFTFSDPTGTSWDFCLNVINRSALKDRVINDSCVTTSAGTMYQHIGDNINSSTFIAVGYVISTENEHFTLETMAYTFDETWKTFGLEGVFYGFLIVITLIMAGIFHPAAAIILGLIALVFVVLMDLMYLSTPVLATIIVIGILAAMKTARGD